jgi:8-amino-7-oxononanoate synthase
LQQAAAQYGVGSGAAHLVCGHHPEHHALEQALAEFTGRERALLFSTGYMANWGTLTALLSAGDTVLQDRLNHASLLDGGLASGAQFHRYRHGDLAHARHYLQRSKGNTIIVTDGVFSMDGDIAPLTELAQLAHEHHAVLMVDDAHGLGVLGVQGAGTLQQLALTQTDVPILMGTLGKALGTFGAFIAGSDVLIETLIQRARPYIYTTALPPAIAAATRASLHIVRAETDRRTHLAALISHFKQHAARLNIPLLPSITPIQPIMIGDSERALLLSQTLLDAGFLVSAIRPPTVPANSARLRVTLSAAHSIAQVDALLAALALLWHNDETI